MPRKTQQRETLRHVIEQAARPLSIAEIHQAGCRVVPRLGIATVYREVARLHAEGILSKVEIPGETAPRYEMRHAHAHHHHHFKCTACNTVCDLDSCGLEIEKLLPRGFQHTGHELTIFGLCRECA